MLLYIHVVKQNIMKISKQTQSFRRQPIFLWKINDEIKKGNYLIEWVNENVCLEIAPAWSIIKFDQMGYPIKNVGAREHKNGKLTLHLGSEWKERLAFLNNELKIDGLTLDEYEDPGFYESLSVDILISSPSSYLDPSII